MRHEKKGSKLFAFLLLTRSIHQLSKCLCEQKGSYHFKGYVKSMTLKKVKRNIFELSQRECSSMINYSMKRHCSDRRSGGETMQFSYQAELLTTYRQTLTLNCAAVRKGKVPGQVSTSRCDTRQLCCSNGTSAGKNLFHMLTRCPGSSTSTRGCNFGTLPTKAKQNGRISQIRHQAVIIRYSEKLSLN